MFDRRRPLPTRCAGRRLGRARGQVQGL